MRCMYRLAAASFVLLTSLYPAGGQSREGVGFDPAPVQIPHVAKSVSRPVESMDLLSMRYVQGLAISPDGKYVAFVLGQAVYETNSYRSGLFVVGTAPGSIPLCLGTAGMPHWDRIHQWSIEAPEWSADARHITYRMKTRTEDSWQVWRWDRDGGEPVQLTHAAGNVGSYQWSPDGSKLVLTVEKQQDPKDSHDLSWRGLLYDGSILAWEQLPVVEEVLEAKPPQKEVWIHDLGTGAERKATEREREEYGPWVSDLPEGVKDRFGDSSRGHHIENAKISPDGLKVAYQLFVENPKGSRTDAWRLFSKPVRGGTPTELTPGVYYVGQYWWSGDSGRIYYTENHGDGHASRLMMTSVTGGSPRTVLTTTDPLGQYSMDVDGRYIACTRENNTTPAQIALADLSSGTVRTLVDPNPEFQNFELSPTVRMEGTNKFGDSWFGQLVKPLDYEAGKKYPLIITTYRSWDGFLLGASGNENPIRVYAAHGFAVLSFDIGPIRSRRPGDFHDHLLEWSSPITSMEMAIHELSKMGIIDPAKVGITGFSHGAEILEYGISHTNLFHAAVESGPGARDPYFYYMAGREWHEIFSDWGLGGWPEGKSRKRWVELAPSLNASRIETPLLTNAADSEYIIALSLSTSLEQLGKPVELFIYPNELHEKYQPRHRLEIYERNLDWFRFWLKSEEDPNPAKSAQYVRWRKLRVLHEVGNNKAADAKSKAEPKTN